ncbi:hypothetical protein Tco_0419280 [Tanacetum coccineum]
MSLVGLAGDPWSKEYVLISIGKDLDSGLPVYKMPSSRNRLPKAKKGITMAKPNLNVYISATRKNYLSDDNKGRMVEKSFLEIQGTFLVKIHDNAFNGQLEKCGAASEWFKKDCIGSVTTWEDLVEKFIQKFYQLSYNNEEMEVDEDDN